MRRLAVRILAAVAVIAAAPWVATVTQAQPFETVVRGDLRLSAARAAPTRNFTLATEAYLTITNTGGNPDRLLGATAATARVVRIHKWIREDGVEKILSLPDLPIGPGETVVMEPKVLNLKLMGLRRAVPEGQMLTLTLRFERAGDVTLDLPVTLALGSGAR